jgi:hypothetical protein
MQWSISLSLTNVKGGAFGSVEVEHPIQRGLKCGLAHDEEVNVQGGVKADDLCVREGSLVYGR